MMESKLSNSVLFLPQSFYQTEHPRWSSTSRHFPPGFKVTIQTQTVFRLKNTFDLLGKLGHFDGEIFQALWPLRKSCVGLRRNFWICDPRD